MPESMMLLINPYAGRSVTRTALGSAVHAFTSAGYAPAVYYTEGPGSAAQLAAGHGGDYPLLVCMGGDGTLSDTLSGLMELPRERRPRVGYIPMGTANDVATTLSLPMRQPGRAAELILQSEPLNYDVGQMLGQGYFSYIAAFGAFTAVSYKTNQELKRALGHAAYVLEGISSLSALRTYHIKAEYDDGELEDDVIYGALSNAMSVGGMVKMSREMVNLSDGRFELILARKPKDAAELNAMVGSILSRSYDSPCLTVLHTSRVKFTFDEDVPWTRDGEDGGAHRSLELLCHRQAVELLC